MPVTMTHATRFVGRHVVAHHMNGTAYHGVLQSVNDRGIYMRNARGIRPVSATSGPVSVEHAISQSTDDLDVSECFFPFFFLAFGALAALAAASAYYPYGYGYGYGYGYPGYYW